MDRLSDDLYILSQNQDAQMMYAPLLYEEIKWLLSSYNLIPEGILKEF